MQFDKATLVAKLKAARDRKLAATGKCTRRKSHAERRPELVALARKLHRKRKGERLSLRAISAELAKAGYFNQYGKPFAATSVAAMVASSRRSTGATI